MNERSATRDLVHRALIILGIVLSALAVLLTLWLGIRVILVGFIGLLLAILLRGTAEWLARTTGTSVRWCLPVVILVLFGGIIAGVLFLIPQAVDQLGQLQEKLVDFWPQIRQWIGQAPLGTELVHLLTFKNKPFWRFYHWDTLNLLLNQPYRKQFPKLPRLLPSRNLLRMLYVVYDEIMR